MLSRWVNCPNGVIQLDCPGSAYQGAFSGIVDKSAFPKILPVTAGGSDHLRSALPPAGIPRSSAVNEVDSWVRISIMFAFTTANSQWFPSPLSSAHHAALPDRSMSPISLTGS